MTIRVLVVDDQAMIRESFRVALDSQADVEVVGEAGTGADAVVLARDLAPDVVLMDVRMPVMDGLEATRRVVDSGDEPPKVLVLTTFDLDEHVRGALRNRVQAAVVAHRAGLVDEDFRPVEGTR